MCVLISLFSLDDPKELTFMQQRFDSSIHSLVKYKTGDQKQVDKSRIMDNHTSMAAVCSTCPVEIMPHES